VRPDAITVETRTPTDAELLAEHDREVAEARRMDDCTRRALPVHMDPAIFAATASEHWRRAHGLADTQRLSSIEDSPTHGDFRGMVLEYLAATAGLIAMGVL